MTHVHRALDFRQLHKRASGCQTYLSPAASDLVEAYAQTTLKWDPACLTTYDSIDIYLQSVDVGLPIHLWKSVTTSDGQLVTSFIPNWWNSTHAATLQIVITGSDQPVWAGSGPGPTFFAEFNGTVPDSASAADKASTQSNGLSVQVINAARSTGLPTKSLAVAVLAPLLAVAFLVAAFILISRRRSGAASKRWSQYVDQRMSIAPNGANWEAGRLPTDPALSRPISARVESMYRHSASLPPRGSLAANRLSSAASIGQHSPPPAMRQPRQSVVSFTQQRQSTVSFADSPLKTSQKSSLSVRTSGIDHSHTPLELLVSPDQETGPASLGPVSLGMNRNSVASSSSNNSSKPAHIYNASMARSTSNLRFEVSGLNGPSAHPTSSNPNSNASIETTFNNGFWQSVYQEHTPPPGMRRLSNVPLSTLSPDEALRQYTLARHRGPNSPVEASAASTGMRVLYTPHAAPTTRPTGPSKSFHTDETTTSAGSETGSAAK